MYRIHIYKRFPQSESGINNCYTSLSGINRTALCRVGDRSIGWSRSGLESWGGSSQ